MESKFILLVEDDPDDVDLTRRAFQRNKITNEIVVVRDGAEAQDFLFGTGAYADRDPRILPSVILLDIKLPKINGFELLRRLRASELPRLIPVVFLTSSREERDLIKGYELGANSYICKPVDFDQFAEAVRQLGLYWLFLNEPPPLSKERRSK